jgi:hypothetical protein
MWWLGSAIRRDSGGWNGAASAIGSISQRPCFDSPSNAAKHAGESKRGRQSQSIEPSRPTSAAEPQSPISA